MDRRRYFKLASITGLPSSFLAAAEVMRCPCCSERQLSALSLHCSAAPAPDLTPFHLSLFLFFSGQWDLRDHYTRSQFRRFRVLTSPSGSYLAVDLSGLPAELPCRGAVQLPLLSSARRQLPPVQLQVTSCTTAVSCAYHRQAMSTK